MRLTGLEAHTCSVSIGASHHVHAGRTSTRVVLKDFVFGGFPCITLMPSFPLRMLGRTIAGMDRADLGIWPEKVAPEDVGFTVNGRSVDEETGLRSMCRWAAAGDDVRVVVAGEGIPWVAR